MTKISLIVPFFSPDKETETKRVKKFRDWCIETFEEKLPRIFPDIEKPDYLFAMTDQVDYIDTNFIQQFKGVTPKGLMVHGKLLSLISKIDYTQIDNHYFVLIDGSGKIAYDNVFNVLDILSKGKQIVLGCRPKDFGVSDSRKDIEHFENFLVEEKYKVVLPDAQCGCWGGHANILKSLPLTAKTYDIEIDLVSSAIANNLSISFIPVTMDINEFPISNFTSFDIDITKLNFLTNKLGLDKHSIQLSYKKFNEIYKIELPEEYLNHFNSVPESKYRKKFDCIGICDKDCKKVYKY
ncbi:MAG: hypothetical protein ABII25_04735 [bacterium]